MYVCGNATNMERAPTPTPGPSVGAPDMYGCAKTTNMRGHQPLPTWVRPRGEDATPPPTHFRQDAPRGASRHENRLRQATRTCVRHRVRLGVSGRRGAASGRDLRQARRQAQARPPPRGRGPAGEPTSDRPMISDCRWRGRTWRPTRRNRSARVIAVSNPSCAPGACARIRALIPGGGGVARLHAQPRLERPGEVA